MNYQVGNFGVSWQQRYIPQTMIGNNTQFVQFVPGEAVSGRAISLDDATIQSKSYTNLTFSYSQDVANGRTWRTALTIQNVFDVDPPIVASFGQRGGSQIVPANYDIFGRQLSLNFDYRF